MEDKGRPIVRLVRHSFKGNGKPLEEDPLHGGPTDCLSEYGRQKAREFGANMGIRFEAYGGSVEHRTYDTAREILLGAGPSEPGIQELPPNPWMGSEKMLWETFGIDKKRFGNTANELGSFIAALLELCNAEQILALSHNMEKAILSSLELGENTLLVSHSPWIEVLILHVEHIKLKQNFQELGWIDFILDEETKKIKMLDSDSWGIAIARHLGSR